MRLHYVEFICIFGYTFSYNKQLKTNNSEAFMFDNSYKFTCVDRFLKYVKYDTQSDDGGGATL